MITLAHTQVNAFVALNVITQDDNGLHFSIVPLVSLGWLIMAIWQCRLMVNRFRFELAMIIADLASQFKIFGKVLGIGFNSLAWGIS